MTELSKAFENILPKIAVTGQSGLTAQYASKGGKKSGKKSAKKGAKKGAKKSAKKRATRKWFPFLGF